MRRFFKGLTGALTVEGVFSAMVELIVPETRWSVYSDLSDYEQNNVFFELVWEQRVGNERGRGERESKKKAWVGGGQFR